MTPPIHKYMYIIAKTILPLYRFRHLEDASEGHPTPDTIPNQVVNLLASQFTQIQITSNQVDKSSLYTP